MIIVSYLKNYNNNGDNNMRFSPFLRRLAVLFNVFIRLNVTLFGTYRCEIRSNSFVGLPKYRKVSFFFLLTFCGNRLGVDKHRQCNIIICIKRSSVKTMTKVMVSSIVGLSSSTIDIHSSFCISFMYS